jgi:hypothetical protein
MLELPNGVPFSVRPQSGIDLDPYVGRNLQVTGPIAYHSELRAWILAVEQAQPLSDDGAPLPRAESSFSRVGRAWAQPLPDGGAPLPPLEARPTPQAAGTVARRPTGLVGELVGILNDTKSRGTFLVTLAVLQKLGPEARPAIPAILRNADRLDLFENTTAPNARDKQIAAEVLAVIDAILGRVAPPRPVAMPPAR